MKTIIHRVLLLTFFAVTLTACHKTDSQSNSHKKELQEKKIEDVHSSSATGKGNKTNGKFSEIGKNARHQQHQQQPVPTQSFWTNGNNVLHGIFHYNGADYGFILTLEYDANSGKFSTPMYQAEGYGSLSPIKVESLECDNNTLQITGNVSGAKTIISATRPEGTSTFQGTMVRGDHSGTCTMTLQ